MSGLLSGSPGRIAGPLSPPARTASRESRRRPDICFFGPWHDRQFSARTGRTCFSKNSVCSAVGGRSVRLPSPVTPSAAPSPHRTIAASSRRTMPPCPRVRPRPTPSPYPLPPGGEGRVRGSNCRSPIMARRTHVCQAGRWKGTESVFRVRDPWLTPHRACPGGVEASAQEGLVSPSPPPPGLPRWSGGFCTRTVGPLLFRPHRACPGGAGACASALGERRTTPLVHKPRSTGASPVGTTDGASQVLVHKPPLHRGKPGGGGGGHRAVEKGRVRLQQTTQEETRLNADPGHRGVDGNAPRKTDGVV